MRPFSGSHTQYLHEYKIIGTSDINESSQIVIYPCRDVADIGGHRLSPQIFASSETEAAASSSAPRKKSKRKSSRKSSRKKSSYRSRNKKRTSTRRKSSRPAAKTLKRAASERLADTAGQQSPALDWIPANLNPGGLRVNSVKPDRQVEAVCRGEPQRTFHLSPRNAGTDRLLSSHVLKALPDSLAGFRVGLNVATNRLRILHHQSRQAPQQHRTNPAFCVTERNPMVRPTREWTTTS